MKIILLPLFIFITPPVISQDITNIQNNYKEIAVCAETVGPDGKIYNTFGEGPCPAGSKKRYGQKRYACPPGNTQTSLNCANQRLDDINSSFGAAQDALLALGQQWADKLSKQALERMTKHNEMVVDDSYQVIDDDEKYKNQTIIEPNHSDINIVPIGEPLISIKSGYYSDCAIPHFNIEMKKMGGWTMYIKQNVPVCKIKKYARYIKEKFYYAPYWNQISSNQNTSPYSMPYKINKKKDLYSMCQTAMGMSAGCGKKKSSEEISFQTGFVTDNSLDFKHLVFIQKFGTILKFNLITNNNSTELFINETDNILKVDNAEIKIIEATDTFIKYKVINNFNI